MERGAPRMAALALAGLVVFAACGDRDATVERDVTVATGATAATGPTGPQPADEVGADPIGIASGEGSLWVVNADIDAKRGSVSRIDPAGGEVVATIRV